MKWPLTDHPIGHWKGATVVLDQDLKGITVWRPQVQRSNSIYLPRTRPPWCEPCCDQGCMKQMRRDIDPQQRLVFSRSDAACNLFQPSRIKTSRRREGHRPPGHDHQPFRKMNASDLSAGRHQHPRNETKRAHA
jgi:hypothetical protein